MRAAELREMSDEQLQLTLNETTESLFRLRIQAQTERTSLPVGSLTIYVQIDVDNWTESPSYLRFSYE